jgi:ferrous iron transport protein B
MVALSDVSPAVVPPAAGPAPGLARVVLLGNPNTGKTTLFNRLCGMRAKTANFPGTTTDARIGRSTLTEGGRSAELIDLPGVYGLDLDLPEARVCRSSLLGEGLYRQPDAVLLVADATNLVRNLVLIGEVLAFGLPTVVALNMVDLAQRRGLSIDAEKLARRLGCAVVPLVARKGTGVTELKGAVAAALASPRGPRDDSRALDPLAYPDLESWAEQVVEESVGGKGAVGSGADTFTERLDQAFTHPVLGLLVFAAIMGGLFWTLFALATVPMDLIEATFKHLGSFLGGLIPPGAVHDLVVDGVIGGIAGTVVFLPQICLLFFLISLLEDTGYLARAAFVMDRILCRFGLPGQAFVPLLSSHACALPGILSAKLIPDRQDRLATILVAPLMSCSARLPVYVLLTSLLFAHRPLAAGIVFTLCYLLGGSAALVSALVIRRTILPGKSRPMVLELPTYKVPSLRNAFLMALEQAKIFLTTAGTVIMAICVVMWWLSAYPKSAPPAAAIALQQQAAAVAGRAPERAAELSSQADFLIAKEAQGNSFAGRIGRTIQPVFAPLGYDWQLTVGVLTSFLAREVFVSTLSVLLIGQDDSADLSTGVIDKIRRAERDDGSPVFTPATAASLLVFFVLAMQCLSTLTVTRRETGSLKWAGLQLAYMSGLAYVAAFVTFHGMRMLGFS